MAFNSTIQLKMELTGTIDYRYDATTLTDLNDIEENYFPVLQTEKCVIAISETETTINFNFNYPTYPESFDVNQELNSNVSKYISENEFVFAGFTTAIYNSQNKLLLKGSFGIIIKGKEKLDNFKFSIRFNTPNIAYLLSNPVIDKDIILSVQSSSDLEKISETLEKTNKARERWKKEAEERDKRKSTEIKSANNQKINEPSIGKKIFILVVIIFLFMLIKQLLFR